MAVVPTPTVQAQAQAISLPTNSLAPFRKPLSAQPPPFRATGRGWFNKLPNFPALSTNANASLTNLVTTLKDFRSLYLFVNAVETGWTLAGETSQSQTSRAFYPRNLSQDELTIEGVVASQYDYDLLVRWVQFHHHNLFGPAAMNGQITLPGDIQFPGVIFQLFQSQNTKISTHPFMRYMVVIESVQAGHQQGQMAGLPFELTCKVVYDYLGKPIDLQQQLAKLANISAVFGDVSNPAPAASWSDLDAATVVQTQVATAQSDGTSAQTIKQTIQGG